MNKSAHQTSGDPNNLYLPRLATIAEVRPETPVEKTFVVELDDDEPFDYLPGQFVMVSVFGSGEIPLGLASSATEGDALIVTCRRYPQGTVTTALHERVAGDHVGVRGPMGNAFPLDEATGADLILIAGGLGLPTLRAALVYALNHRENFGKLFMLYGATQPALRLYKEDLDAWSASDEVLCLQTVDAAGDEDWPHRVGFVTDLVDECDFDPQKAMALMCGPAPMIGPVAERLNTKGLSDERILVNMEANMQCGVGKCGHCALGDKYVCTDGPVFSWSEVQTLREP